MIVPCDGTCFAEVRVNTALAIAVRTTPPPERHFEWLRWIDRLRALEVSLLRAELRRDAERRRN